MPALPYVKSYRDPIAYQKARALSVEIFNITRTFPKEEIYSLTDQVRRSSRAVGAQIAEAWAKRRYDKHFISKLTDADGEQQETQHWIEVASDCGYIDQSQTLTLLEKCSELGRIIAGMIAKSETFCGEPGSRVREQTAEYFTESNKVINDQTNYPGQSSELITGH